MGGRKDQSFEGYIRLSSHFFDDPDIELLTWAERAFYLAMACRIRQLRSDGWLTETQVAKLGYPRWRPALSALVESGMVTTHDSPAGATGYYLPAYLKWNYSESQYEELREKRRSAGAKSRCVTNHGPHCGCWETAPGGNKC